MSVLLLMIVNSCNQQSNKAETDDQAPVLTQEDSDEIDMRNRKRIQADLTPVTAVSEWSEGDTFRLIVDGLSLRMEVTMTRTFLPDIKSLAGTVDGDAQGNFSFSHDNGEYLGNIQLPELRRNFQIVYIESERKNVLFELTN